MPFHEQWHSLSLALGAHGESDGECEGGEDHTQAVAGCGLDGLGGRGLNPGLHLVPHLLEAGEHRAFGLRQRQPLVLETDAQAGGLDRLQTSLKVVEAGG